MVVSTIAVVSSVSIVGVVFGNFRTDEGANGSADDRAGFVTDDGTGSGSNCAAGEGATFSGCAGGEEEGKTKAGREGEGFFYHIRRGDWAEIKHRETVKISRAFLETSERGGLGELFRDHDEWRGVVVLALCHGRSWNRQGSLPAARFIGTWLILYEIFGNPPFPFDMFHFLWSGPGRG